MESESDPYRVLGVARGATKAQIKAAHRALAKRFHPDAASGDAKRFRDVHAAYQLLSDPLQRRDWDAKHSTGPVRADDASRPIPRRPRPAPAAAPAPATPQDPPPTRPPRTAPDTTARTYRWSASEVPWWEEGSRSENRRQPGARRPRSAAQPDPNVSPPPGPRATADFDVYNRSSGAAWSSAARQYFRRFDAELPKHGQFRRQGTQPLTAARARVAAEKEARAQGTQPAAQPVQPAPPVAPAPPPVAATPPRPAYVYTAGVAHTAEQVNAARAATQRAIRAAAWPTLRERLIYALLAWVPIAILVGYGGAAATGCDRAAVACPAWFGPAQSVSIALILGLLVGLPRLAYIGAAATLGLTAAAVVAVALLALDRVEAPFSSTVLLIGGGLLLATYLVSGALVVVNRSMQPWVAAR